MNSELSENLPMFVEKLSTTVSAQDTRVKLLPLSTDYRDIHLTLFPSNVGRVSIGPAMFELPTVILIAFSYSIRLKRWLGTNDATTLMSAPVSQSILSSRRFFEARLTS